MKTYEEWRYSSTILYLDTTSRWVWNRVNFEVCTHSRPYTCNCASQDRNEEKTGNDLEENKEQGKEVKEERKKRNRWE
jgi:hypothetical protein